MADNPSASSSLKDYLKKYMSNDDREMKNKKKKKKRAKPGFSGVIVVDEDPIWQKPVNLGDDDEEDAPDEEKPQFDEDVDVKRIKRLELLRSKRPLGAISDDGSGWVSISTATTTSNVRSEEKDSEIRNRNDSPSPKGRAVGARDGQTARYDTPSEASDSDGAARDLSPPRRKQRDSDISPPRRKQRDSDISPPRRKQRDSDISPPRRKQRDSDISPPRRRQRDSDISPPRRPRRDSEFQNEKHSADLSPPRKVKNESHYPDRTSDLSPPRKKQLPTQRRQGLVSAEDIKDEISRRRKEDFLKFKQMDPSVSGRNAAAVYRDKATGQRMTREAFLDSQKKQLKKDSPPKEVKLEWGKGLAQKREAEARLQDMESEKNKPFARTRDDPDLDKMLKERVRWGDPMAHLVRKKHSEEDDAMLPDLGDDEGMKRSGFIIPQQVPNHSWIKRGIEAAANRYGIKPGRHWDGVDRSNGYEKELFKRTNDRRATEQEAYLWSVADM
ncbi:hypothetical protein M569_00932 [Genlisea aurea]|uniref:BUD13 homolog n=1 Tax=Genlisea aurea TaxID=192259 RepID=S8D8S3_9LAMI|nr:hypothetical protein M569_00932 [Genlisea aurea]